MIFNYLILKNRFVTYADIVCRIRYQRISGYIIAAEFRSSTDFCVEKEGAGLSARLKASYVFI